MNKRCRSLIGVAAAVLVSSGSDAAVTGQAPAAPSMAVSIAARPVLRASTTTLSVNACEFTVTYSWSGLKGRNHIASFGLFERKGSLDESFNLHNVEGQLGKSGSLTHTFSLTAGASGGRTILARGRLFDSRKYAVIDGSASASAMISSTCG